MTSPPWPEDLPVRYVRIARPTGQLDEVVRFYCEGLGLPELGRFAGHAGYRGVLLGLPGMRYHPLVLVWDNLNTHVSAAITELIAARDLLTVHQLPPYAPELNPVEPLWSHLKRSLANLAKRNLSQLTALVKTRLKRMQYRPSLLNGFLASTGLDLTPFL